MQVRNAKLFLTAKLPGTSGPLDRDADLKLTTAEVQTALEEVRAAKKSHRMSSDLDAYRARSERLFESAVLLEELLKVVERAGGSYAYLGASFQRFQSMPPGIQVALAIAAGRRGALTVNAVHRLQQRTMGALRDEAAITGQRDERRMNNLESIFEGAKEVVRSQLSGSVRRRAEIPLLPAEQKRDPAVFARLERLLAT